MKAASSFLASLAFASAALAGCGQQAADPSLTPEARPFANIVNYRFAARFPAWAPRPKGLALDCAGRILVAGAGMVAELAPDGERRRLITIDGEAHCIAPSRDGGFFVGLTQRVDEYDKDGAKTSSWGKPGKGEGELGNVTSIAVSDYNLLVADALNRVVHRFDTTGDFITSIGKRDPSGAPGIITPSMYLDCAVSTSNEIVIGNPGRLRVEIFDLDGKMLRTWGAGGAAPNRFAPCCNPIHVAIGPNGEIVTVEKGLPRIKVHDSRGNLLAVLGIHTARAAGQSVSDPAPSDTPLFGDVAVDASGRILVIYSPASEIWIFEPPGGERKP
ncbi:MAG TPA: NHL repeat-containing protein [Candidatus Brocadiia bacterium]|nr:NHL repeat-containing protein [Candidatus Brocadiia bacterium]